MWRQTVLHEYSSRKLQLCAAYFDCPAKNLIGTVRDTSPKKSNFSSRHPAQLHSRNCLWRFISCFLGGNWPRISTIGIWSGGGGEGEGDLCDCDANLTVPTHQLSDFSSPTPTPPHQTKRAFYSFSLRPSSPPYPFCRSSILL